jgi:CRP/FNR family transcriptional regulator, cyclic AMP receptor protein
MLATLPGRDASVVHGPKAVIFHQGDPADAVFHIDEGTVKVSIVSEQGREAVIALLGPGSFLGEGCLAGQPLHMASAIAVDRAVVTRIDKSTMIRALHTQPAFAEAFTAFLLLRNIQIESDLVDQLFNSSERRLARMLLLLANFGKDGSMEKVIPKVSQDALAARVGTTRSRINFFMNKFRKLGFIEYNGELKVHSSLLNVIVQESSNAPAHRRTPAGRQKPKGRAKARSDRPR